MQTTSSPANRVRLGIGDFSRMTYLSVKALRHYHDVGVLEPVEVDASSGYRYYAPQQVGLAQMIRRLRDLGMPLEEVRTIVQAPDAETRDRALVTHLRRMERQLEETQQSVASLRSLLEAPREALQIEQRSVPRTAAIAISDQVVAEEAVAWWMAAFTALHDCLADLRLVRSGPDGALFPPEFFEDEVGQLTCFVPLRAPVDVALPARIQGLEIDGGEFAATNHRGPFGDLDRTYGGLGRWVLERAAGAPGPIREYYLPTGDPNDLLAHTTDVCWPIVG
ncbi:MAG TPA: MerR family transcriptional regulator [Mycobacteriales bacterium]|nr:MerR family transcriptional regulator [Mycobacteriales bacterium]